jgi:hypothetical protein
MVKELIKRKPVLIGVITVIAFYVVSNILSNLNATLPTFLAIGIVVGFMVGEDFKTGAINSALFGAIGAVIISLILVVTYILYGYGAYLGYVAQGLVISFVLYVVTAIVGGLIGTQVKIESDSIEAEPVEQSE